MNRIMRAVVYAEEQEDLAQKNRRGRLQRSEEKTDVLESSSRRSHLFEGDTKTCDITALQELSPAPLLTLPSASWKCLNSSNENYCIAPSPQKTLFAVGCRGGRIEIWDNVSIRVIKAILDPMHTVKMLEEGLNECAYSAKPKPENNLPQPLRQSDSKEVSLHELKGLKYVMACVWSCDSHFIFSGCEGLHHNSILSVWDVGKTALIKSISFPSGSITLLSSHPRLPKVIMLCQTDHSPLWVDLDRNAQLPCQYPLNMKEETDPAFVPKNRVGRFSSIFGCSGDWVYVTSSDGYVAIYRSCNAADTELSCVSAIQTSTAIQITCICCNQDESALLVTCVKGLLELAIIRDKMDATKLVLSEVRLYSSGAVRVSWSVCCFSGSSESNVMGIPVPRQRHVVGENAVYEWNRQNGCAYHGVGVKEGLSTLTYVSYIEPNDNLDCGQHPLNQDTIFAISSSGSLYVYEHTFSTAWHGPMYPPGFRVVDDNEVCDSPHSESKEKSIFASGTSEPILLDSNFSSVWEEELFLLPSVPDLTMRSRIEDTDPISPMSFGLEHSIFKPHQDSPGSSIKVFEIKKQKRKSQSVTKPRKSTTQRRPRL